MKIIIPVTNSKEGEDIIVCGLHNTNFVCIYDTVEKNYQWLNKKEISIKDGNMCLNLKLKGILTIITSEIELMSLSLFIDAGLKVYKTKADNVEENIKMFESNQLTLFNLKAAIGIINCDCKGSHKISYN